ncbi:Na+/H+ antiporter subunit E [Oceanirhabdus sp. W0125-5]|uniref:Na+/H+ antiporter subunit E n=1 Tax=Oceanirhabdus sp. W0125-5 TaxID=2999116 RepID=UPI0022F2F4F1|nr:Na+/H+ antiporter subunit E [Oceanirhabdus sp. W0125-5]WBW95393.1 Na+/H+ antiporter subunit E [Oceanirhabdus sp. W0125-5]
MNKFLSYLSTFVFCMLIWVGLTIPFGTGMGSGQILQELIVGGVVSAVMAIFCHRFFIKSKPFWLLNPMRILSFLVFIFIFFVELVKSNLDVAIRALSPKVKVKPGIVKIKTPIESDYGLSMLANCITLTPGTITMDIEKGNKENFMYIHWIDVQQRDRGKASDIIKGSFEPWVRRIFK